MSMTIYRDNLPVILIDRHIGDDAIYGKGITGADFVRELNAIENMGYHKCEVWINSVGGSVMDGMDIYNAIASSKIEIDTRCVGIAASTAGFIFQAGKKRIMNDYSRLMMHNPYGGDSNALDSIKSSIVTMLASRCAKSELQISNMMEKETWLKSTECKDMGLCDDVESLIEVEIEVKDKSPYAIYNKLKSVVNRLIEEPTNKIEDMKKVKNFLNLSEDASEESVMKEITSLKDNSEALAKSLKETQDALKAKEDELKSISDAKEKAEKESAALTLVENSIKAGRIDADAKEGFVALAISDFEGVKNTLEKMPVRSIAKKLVIENKGDEGRAGWDYDKWQKEDPNGLINMYNNSRASYDLLLNKWNETKNANK